MTCPLMKHVLQCFMCNYSSLTNGSRNKGDHLLHSNVICEYTDTFLRGFDMEPASSSSAVVREKHNVISITSVALIVINRKFTSMKNNNKIGYLARTAIRICAAVYVIFYLTAD